MLLSSLEVHNFRSLEHIKIEGLSQLNVFIGRNNAGKSTVLAALQYLATKAFRLGGSDNLPNDSSVLTAHESSRELAYYLEFKISDEERRRLIGGLVQTGLRRERMKSIFESPFLQQVSCKFSAPMAQPHLIDLVEVIVRSGDDNWSKILVSGEHKQGPYKEYIVSGAFQHDALYQSESLEHNELDVLSGRWVKTAVSATHGTSLQTWMMPELARYFTTACFFSPFRHSSDSLLASPRMRLAPDGSDLSVVLNHLSGKFRRRFKQVEDFLHEAVPGIGTLHSGFVDSEQEGSLGQQRVEVTFESPDGYDVRLREMGGGVEQLLMVATTLATVEEGATLFLEEPELHLHPGAQRYLIERLRADSRQVFITTHSPVFVNLRPPRSLYLVRMVNAKTTVDRITDATDFADLMDDIGARNSDVLLSDAVLFVEGPTDREIVENWARTLGKNLGEHNVSVIAMGGGRNAEHQAPARSQVLEGISSRAPVPHMFLLDNDERGRAEIEHLKNQLEQRLHLLYRREIENYLLVPRAIVAALEVKYHDNSTVLEQVQNTTPSDVHQLIQQAAAGLYGQTLLKRIKVEVGGLRDGLFPSESISVLASKVNDPGFATLVEEVIKDGVDDIVLERGLASLIQTEREALTAEWNDPELRLSLAPGPEILQHVFRHFGGDFNKRKDSPRIASAMLEDEIDPEIAALIKRLAELSNAPLHAS